MTNGSKQFLFWWITAYMGFVVVRIFLGLALDAKALIGGLIIQFVLVSICAGGVAFFKRLLLKRRKGSAETLNQDN